VFMDVRVGNVVRLAGKSTLVPGASVARGGWAEDIVRYGGRSGGWW
jgi:hypothetical protein